MAINLPISSVGSSSLPGVAANRYLEQLGGPLDRPAPGPAGAVRPGPAGQRGSGAEPVASRARSAAELGDEVGDGLPDRLRVDPVLAVVLLLDEAPALGLGDGAAHRVRDHIRVQDDPARDVPGGPSHRLDE